jgi:hypothetical protein
LSRKKQLQAIKDPDIANVYMTFQRLSLSLNDLEAALEQTTRLLSLVPPDRFLALATAEAAVEYNMKCHNVVGRGKSG